MSLRDVLRRGHKAMQFGGYGGGYGSGYGDFWGGGSDLLRRLDYDYRREAGVPWENSVFWIALRWIANGYQEADPCGMVTVKGSGRPQINLDHPWARLMNDPNDDYDGGTLAWAIVTSLLCAGRAYMIVGRSNIGIPTSLYWVPWWQIVPRWPTNGSKYIGWYDYLVNGETIALPRDAVVDLKVGMNPLNYRVGISGTESVLPQICTLNEGARFMAAVTRNPSVFSQLFSPKGEITLTKEQHSQLKAQLKDQGAGENRGNILLPSVPLEVHKLAWSPEELALDTILKMPEAHICAALGVSTTALNLTAGERRDTFNNKAVARREAYENGVMPLQRLVARQMRRQLPVLFQSNEVPGYSYLNVSCMQEQRADRAERLTKACGGAYMSVNEARAEDGLEPLGEEYNELRGTPGADQETGSQDGQQPDPEDDDEE